MQPSSKKNTPMLLIPILCKAVAAAIAVPFFFLFVAVAAFFFHLCIAAGSLLRRHYQFPSFAELGSGLEPEDLSKIQRFRYKGGDDERTASMEDCVVCLRSLKHGDWCRVLPQCGHKFHADCIDQWLFKAPLCPICRRGVRLVGDFTGSGSSAAMRAEECKSL